MEEGIFRRRIRPLPPNLVIIMTGNVSRDHGFQSLSRLLGMGPGGKPVVVVVVPGSVVVIGRIGVSGDVGNPNR
jgi:hypothetical protein